VTGEHQKLALLLFCAFVALTLALTLWAGRRRHGSPEEIYAGGRLCTPRRSEEHTH
jgi:cation/acetate symporter